MPATDLFFTRNYVRPDFRSALEHARELSDELTSARSPNGLMAIMGRWDNLRRFLDTQRNYLAVRNLLNLEDRRAQAERTYWNQQSTEPEIEQLYAGALLKSQQHDSIKERFGAQCLRLAEAHGATACVSNRSPDAVELISRYETLTSRRRWLADGQKHNPLSVRALFDAEHVQTRREAWLVREQFLAEYGSEVDEIFDSLVRLRTEQARKAGYQNYSDFSQHAAERIGYGRADIQNFLQAIKQHLVPVAARTLHARQRRLGVRSLDVTHEQAPTSLEVVSSPQMLDALSETFERAHPALNDFLRVMKEHQAFDLERRDDKVSLAQCTGFAELGLPFVIAQLGSRPRDVLVLLHEFGHAFQLYLARQQSPLDYWCPTCEGSEFCAIGFTHLCLNHTDAFFGGGSCSEGSAQFRHNELQRAATSIPFLALMEAYQQAIYGQPELSPKQRRALWKQLEKQYLPWRGYPDWLPLLGEGASYLLVPHFFSFPFQGLDYALAHVMALELRRNADANSQAMWNGFLEMCAGGGRNAFLDLLTLGGLGSPFQATTVQASARYLAHQLHC